MRGTFDAASDLNKLIKYSIDKISNTLKGEDTLNSLREDTAQRKSGDRTLWSNCWAVRGTLLQSIVDNSVAFQELWDRILEAKVD